MYQIHLGLAWACTAHTSLMHAQATLTRQLKYLLGPHYAYPASCLMTPLEAISKSGCVTCLKYLRDMRKESEVCTCKEPRLQSQVGVNLPLLYKL